MKENVKSAKSLTPVALAVSKSDNRHRYRVNSLVAVDRDD
jgi:hypothetical protein